MKISKRSSLLIFYSLVLFLVPFWLACERDFSAIKLIQQEPPKDSLKFESGLTHLGLSQKFIWELRIFNDNLYICAGRDGLYKMDLVYAPIEFTYLGLMDTSNLGGRGVQDVWASEDETILIATVLPTSSEQHVLYRSEDSGKTWVFNDSAMAWEYNGIVSHYSVRKFSILTSNKILVIGERTYKTENKGKTWEQISDGTTMVNDASVHRSSETVWFGGQGGYFAPSLAYSNDEGLTWNFISFDNVLPNEDSIRDIALHPVDPSTLFVGTLDKILKSTDHGQTWSDVFVTHGFYAAFEDIVIDPDQPNHIYATDKYSLYESNDEGIAWAKILNLNDDAYSMIYLEDKHWLFIGTENGLYVCKP